MASSVAIEIVLARDYRAMLRVLRLKVLEERSPACETLEKPLKRVTKKQAKVESAPGWGCQPRFLQLWPKSLSNIAFVGIPLLSTIMFLDYIANNEVAQNQRNLMFAGFLFTVFLSMITRSIAASRNVLNAVPVPMYARFTNLRPKWPVITGQRMYYVHALHQKYGHYVRIAPNEVAVSSPERFTHIHRVGSGFTKSRWYGDLVGSERLTLFTMTDPKLYAVRRRLLTRNLGKTYLCQHWEHLVRDKIRSTVTKFKEESMQDGKTDMMNWWTLMATDIATHLIFGESFHMIEEGQMSWPEIRPAWP